jgi:hypothetical protein
MNEHYKKGERRFVQRFSVSCALVLYHLMLLGMLSSAKWFISLVSLARDTSLFISGEKKFGKWSM